MLSFPRGATIAGFPVTALKAILRSIDRTNSLHSAQSLQSTGLTRLQNAIATEVAMQAGLIDRQHLSLTDLGYAFVASTSKARLPKAKAANILAELLQSALRCNTDPEITHNVSEIWLYGSHARGADTVGDIDLVITWSRKPHLTHDESEQIIQDEYNQRYTAWATPWDQQKLILNRYLYGAKRHSALSVTSDLDTLIAMAEPCMKVFDIASGIIDNPQLLDKHPKATVRSKRIRERITADDRDKLLSFVPTPNLLPATYSCSQRGYWDANPDNLDEYRPIERQVHLLAFRGHDNRRSLRVFTHADAGELRFCKMDTLPAAFDGWEMALIVSDFRCFMLKRRIETSNIGCTELHVELQECPHEGAPRAKLIARDHPAYHEMIGIYLAMLAQNDLCCLETLAPDKSRISVTFSTPGYDRISRFAEKYLERLTVHPLQTQKEPA